MAKRFARKRVKKEWPKNHERQMKKAISAYWAGEKARAIKSAKRVKRGTRL